MKRNNKLYLKPGVGPEYVRLTYTPAGEKPVSVWAEKIATKKPHYADGKLVVGYWKVNGEGERPEPEELILVTESEVIAKPARMNLYYGKLERVR